MECLSITLTAAIHNASLDLTKLDDLLKTAPKDEVYRIKAILYSTEHPKSSPINGVKIDGNGSKPDGSKARFRYILNWSFGRWTWSSVSDEASGASTNDPVLRMSVFTAPYESNKWMKKIESGSFIALFDAQQATGGVKLEVKRVQ